MELIKLSMCDYCRHHDCQQPQWAIQAVLNNDMYCQAFRSWLERDMSMAYVTASFCAEQKNITRRNWTDRYSRQFTKGIKALVWNKQARFGGEPIGVLELTENPFKQNTNEMPMADYENEGFEYLDDRYTVLKSGASPLVEIFNIWHDSDKILTVIPFKIIEIFPGALAKYTTDEEIIRCVKALVKAIG